MGDLIVFLALVLFVIAVIAGIVFYVRWIRRMFRRAKERPSTRDPLDGDFGFIVGLWRSTKPPPTRHKDSEGN